MTMLTAGDVARDRLSRLRKAGKIYSLQPPKKPEPMLRTKKITLGQPGDSLGQATLGRMSHGGELEIVGEGSKFRQRVVYPLEKLAEHFQDWEYNALSTFRELSAVANTVHVTSPYTGGLVDGGAGIGTVSERQRRAIKIVEHVTRRAGPNLGLVIRELVLNEPLVGQEKVRSLEQVASSYTTWKDPARLRGVGVGLLKAAAWVVERAMRDVIKSQ